ncbi:MAG: hypothetical protein GF311_14305 [Candidatus Lokiarchaeota archaeon]|nr:hypothetical protein [Candidatus Lokiarchaeota archaeon]
MVMGFKQSVVCKLGGHVNSNPELVVSYPPLNISNAEDQKETINECLPFGCKAGDIIEKKYRKNTMISYIFTIDNVKERDDLFSFSILLNKKDEIDLYKAVIQEFIVLLRKNGLLEEKTFIDFQESIYNSFNQEIDLTLGSKSFPLSQMFKDKRDELNLSEFEPRGSFF